MFLKHTHTHTLNCNEYGNSNLILSVCVCVCTSGYLVERVKKKRGACVQTQCASAFSFMRVGVCLHDRTSISLAACSALVAVRCPEGGPTARIKPTPAAAAAAAALNCRF